MGVTKFQAARDLLPRLCGVRALFVRLVIHVANAHDAVLASTRKPQRFIHLCAIVGEFVGPADLSPARAFLVGYQPVAVPMRRNLLCASALRLLQLSSVGKKSALARLVVEYIDFDVLLGLRNGQRTRRSHKLLHPLAVFVALVSASAPSSSVWTSSHSRNAHAHSATPASSAVRSCGRASGDDGGCGCAAGNGPAGACALAPSGQHSPAKTRIPAILEMCPYLKIVLFIRSRDSRYSFPARVQKVPLVGRSNRELAPLPWLEGRHPKGLLQRKVFRERIFAEFART